MDSIPWRAAMMPANDDNYAAARDAIRRAQLIGTLYMAVSGLAIGALVGMVIRAL